MDMLGWKSTCNDKRMSRHTCSHTALRRCCREDDEEDEDEEVGCVDPPDSICDVDDVSVFVCICNCGDCNCDCDCNCGGGCGRCGDNISGCVR